MPKVFECTRCGREFGTAKEFMNHPCVTEQEPPDEEDY